MKQAKLLYGVDVIDGLKTLADNSVHCVVTSPPYWALRDYGVEGQLGLEKTPEEFVDKMTAVFREVRRVLRHDGTAWVNMGDGYANSGGAGFQGKNGARADRRHTQVALGKKASAGIKNKDLVGMPWMLAFALRADGWYLRSEIIWSKPNPMPESVTDRPTKSHETIFLLTKSSKYFYDEAAIREEAKDWGTRDRTGQTAFTEGVMPGGQPHSGCKNINFAERGRNKRSVWEIATQPYPEAHFATFPAELPKVCILAGTSTKGCCSECAAPFKRIVEVSGGDIGKSWHDHKADKVNGQRCGNKAKGGNGYTRETKNWVPTCSCEQGGGTDRFRRRAGSILWLGHHRRSGRRSRPALHRYRLKRRLSRAGKKTAWAVRVN